jgi:NAD(P)-dependent dehydrogenase (short-subunit alcohol dehydrogenase family)
MPGHQETAGDSLHLHNLANTDFKQARRAFELRYWAALAAASVCGTIEALTRALALELAPIRVNAVSPGVVRTNL